jgi:hypothetical protein
MPFSVSLNSNLNILVTSRLTRTFMPRPDRACRAVFISPVGLMMLLTRQSIVECDGKGPV